MLPHCPFCVNEHSDGVKFHAHVKEFLDGSRKYIHLFDDNILGYPKWRDVFEELAETGKRFSYRQGMDIRIMTEEKAEVLSKAKYLEVYTFAFDSLKEREPIERGLSVWRKHNHQIPQLYVLCGYEGQGAEDIASTFERIHILSRYGALPYIMRHANYANSKYKGTYINIGRWCNQPNFLKKMTYREFCYANKQSSSTARYAEEFEHDYPEIAAKYYDMRWSDLREIV